MPPIVAYILFLIIATAVAKAFREVEKLKAESRRAKLRRALKSDMDPRNTLRPSHGSSLAVSR